MHVFLLLILMLVAPVGCAREEPAPSRPLLRVPVELTVKQRSTTDVPGSAGALRLTIDDITGGQVMVSLADSTGKDLLATTSLSPGDAAKFNLNAGLHQIELKELSNALVGEDFATFVVSSATADALTETEKIEQLIAAVDSAEGLIFIRNNAEHSAPRAADHLRGKWKAAGDRVATAKQFIEHIGSKSSQSGKPYRIRLPDGKEMPAGEWLQNQLAQIENSPPTDSD